MLNTFTDEQSDAATVADTRRVQTTFPTSDFFDKECDFWRTPPDCEGHFRFHDYSQSSLDRHYVSQDDVNASCDSDQWATCHDSPRHVAQIIDQVPTMCSGMPSLPQCVSPEPFVADEESVCRRDRSVAFPCLLKSYEERSREIDRLISMIENVSKEIDCQMSEAGSVSKGVVSGKKM